MKRKVIAPILLLTIMLTGCSSSSEMTPSMLCINLPFVGLTMENRQQYYPAIPVVYPESYYIANGLPSPYASTSK